MEAGEPGKGDDADGDHGDEDVLDVMEAAEGRLDGAAEGEADADHDRRPDEGGDGVEDGELARRHVGDADGQRADGPQAVEEAEDQDVERRAGLDPLASALAKSGRLRWRMTMGWSAKRRPIRKSTWSLASAPRKAAASASRPSMTP